MFHISDPIRQYKHERIVENEKHIHMVKEIGKKVQVPNIIK